MNRLGTGQGLPHLAHLAGHKHLNIQKPKKGATKKSESKRKKDDEDYTENIEEGLARSQSLLRFGAGDDETRDYLLFKEEMLNDLEDEVHEAELIQELTRALSELQPEDIALVDRFSKTQSQPRMMRLLKSCVLSLGLLNQARTKAHNTSLDRISKLVDAYSCYQNAVEDKATAILTEELIEYSLSESAWQEVRAHRHSPSIRSIAIEKIRTYSLKHTISQRYCGSCFNLQVRSLEQKETSHDRDELVSLDAGQIKEALLAASPDREKLLGQISMQYICDQIVSKEGGFKFQAKLATAYRACAIIRGNNLKLNRPTCYNTIQIKGVKI